ncbi:MAG: hypothetical protein LBI34_00745 [Puniceicoccales bacterium]|jgi:multiple antibiotic resistance protein|nr:hypothetical protein [Puniceicoccales bacterium]
MKAEIDMTGLVGDAWNAFCLLWNATNPIATALIFSSLAGYHSVEARTKIIYDGGAIAFFLVLVFAFWGTAILNFLGVNMAAIEFVSGFALAFLALSVLHTGDNVGKIAGQNFSVIPLALPFLGSPGTLICAMNLYTKASSITQKASIVVSWACMVSLACGLLFLFSRLIRAAGGVVTSLLFRLAGLLTLALGMQYAFSGILQLLPDGLLSK